ncbi:MAG: hypothetical protein U0703_20345 [Anaerolineae bacterium]
MLDEPSAGLDPRGGSLIDLLRTFDQRTLLISTHDMRPWLTKLCPRSDWC